MKNPEDFIDRMYKVLVEGYKPHEVDSELYDEDEDTLNIIAPDYVNRLGTEFGEKVIYWEENYNPSAYRMGEKDGEREKEIIDTLEEYGIEFDIDLVKKYPDDYPNLIDNRFILKILTEVSAPSYYDLETNKLITEESDKEIQAYWVVSYDTEEEVVEEWLERFYDSENAKKYIEKIKKGKS